MYEKCDGGILLSYDSYLKKEIEKVVFIEINENLTLDLEGYPQLEKGEYPILPVDLVEMGKAGKDALSPSMIIDGMIYMIACDKTFKYNLKYIEFLNKVKAVQSYIIMKINSLPEDHLKTKLILASALVQLSPKCEFMYNRTVILMKLYEKNGQQYIEEQIVDSLEKLIELYPDFMKPYYHLGEYYIAKDMDKAKLYLRKCLKDNELAYEANLLLEGISGVEKFDEAVEYVKNEQGMEALKILLPIIHSNNENLDARYYAAMAYRQTGNYTKALIYLKELTEIAERPEVYSEIAINLAELEDFDGALEYFRKALKITPDDAGILCNIGACHLNLSQFDEAKRMFELASRINPSDDIPKKWLMAMEAQLQGN